MIQMPTTQLTPVGVGWGDYVVAWLLSYGGADCRLWQYVFQKCMESELCRRVLELLPSIGLDVRRHKCYAEPAEIEVETEQAKPPNNASTATTKATNQTNHSKLLKTKAPQSLSRVCPESLPEVPQTRLPSPNPPLIDVFQRGSPGSRGFGVEPSPAFGGSPPPDHWVQ